MYKAEKTQVMQATKIDTTKDYTNQVIRRKMDAVNINFLQMIGTPRYDIELPYGKRWRKESEII